MLSKVSASFFPGIGGGGAPAACRTDRLGSTLVLYHRPQHMVPRCRQSSAMPPGRRVRKQIGDRPGAEMRGLVGTNQD